MDEYLKRLTDIVEKAKQVPGAISVTEMIAIYDLVRKNLTAESSTAVDLGAHAGKSSMVASAAMWDMGRKDLFCLVDLMYDVDHRGWWDTVQGKEAKSRGDDRVTIPWPIITNPRFHLNVLAWCMSVSSLRHVLFGVPSVSFLSEDKGPFSYVFVDTDDHRAELCLAESKAFEDKVAEGGLVLFHDYGNYRGPVSAGEYLAATGKYEEIGVNWDKYKKVVEDHGLEGDNDSWAPPEHRYLGCFRRK